MDYLQIKEKYLLNNLKGLGRVSYRDKSLTLFDIADKRSITLAGFDVFPDWSYLSTLWGSQ